MAARLVVNPHSGLSPRERTRAIDWCVHAQIKHSDYCWEVHGNDPDSSLFALLMAEDKDLCGTVMASIGKLWFRSTEGLNWKVLDLRGANMVDLRQVAELSSVKMLLLADTDVTDVRCITALAELIILDLNGTAVADVTPLGDMPQIGVLSLERTNVADITPLARLRDLDMLLLSGTPTSAQAIAALQGVLPHCDIVKDY